MESDVNAVDAFFHWANFFAPAVFVGVAVPLLARLVWRGELKVPSLRSAMGWASAASALALLGGLLVFGRDGKMATYGAMLLACALSLWYRGLRRPD